MLNENQIGNLKTAFRRIFAMPITKSTFREIQNAIFTVSDGDTQGSSDLFETLLSGKIKEGVSSNNTVPILEQFVEDYSIFIRTAKDVFERGEFISLVTSDILTQKVNEENRIAFLTRIRRVDGQELHFIADTDGAVNLIDHFVGRLHELTKNDETRKLLGKNKDRLKQVLAHLKELV